jgi:uncharacterized membrane protein YecN with MAPEG domain
MAFAIAGSVALVGALMVLGRVVAWAATIPSLPLRAAGGVLAVCALLPVMSLADIVRGTWKIGRRAG